MAISKARRLAKKRECERKRRAKICSDPVLLAAEKVKRRERDAKRKLKGSCQQNGIESEQTIRKRRKDWKEAKRKYRAKQKALQESTQSHQAISAKKIVLRKKSKCYYENSRLKDTVQKLTKSIWKYKTRYFRLQSKVDADSNSPRTLLKKDLRQESVSPWIKKKLLYGEAL